MAFLGCTISIAKCLDRSDARNSVCTDLQVKFSEAKDRRMKEHVGMEL